MVHMNLFFAFDYELGQLDTARSRTRFTFPASFSSVPSLLLHAYSVTSMHGLLMV
jgi:hypothetical protein